MKKYLLLLFLCLTLFLYGCTEKTSDTLLSCTGVADKIQSAVEFTTLTDVSESYLEKYLLIEADVLDSWVMRRDATRATPEMILVVKIKDGIDQAAIKQSIQEYLDEQLFQYRDYQPSQVYKLENAKVLECDSFIVLAVSPDASKVHAALGNGWK